MIKSKTEKDIEDEGRRVKKDTSEDVLFSSEERQNKKVPTDISIIRLQKNQHRFYILKKNPPPNHTVENSRQDGGFTPEYMSSSDVSFLTLLPSSYVKHRLNRL
jgi:hypothetical protein